MTDTDLPPKTKSPKRHVRKIILSNFKKFERLESLSIRTSTYSSATTRPARAP
jgi:hypothetical protein